MKTRSAMLVMLVGLSLPILGCGSDNSQAEVSGQVVFNGSPVQAGMLSFDSNEKGAGPPRNVPIQQGSYQATLPPGSYLVRITASASQQGAAASIEEAIHDTQAYVPLLPPEWNEKSKLTVEVRVGKNTLTFRGEKDQAPTVETGP